jgi:hypothetical protein
MDIHIAVCDDEQEQAQYIKMYVDKWAQDILVHEKICQCRGWRPISANLLKKMKNICAVLIIFVLLLSSCEVEKTLYDATAATAPNIEKSSETSENPTASQFEDQTNEPGTAIPVIETTGETLQDSKIKMILDSENNEYEIPDNIYVNKDYPNVFVKYPQITGLEDKEIEVKITQMILKKVDFDFIDNIYEEMGFLIDYLDQFGITYENQQTYDITLARDNFLCIRWSYHHNSIIRPGEWHDINMIDMITGIPVAFLEFCDLGKEAFDILYNAQMWDKCGDKGRPFDDVLIQKLYEDNISWDCACFYEDHFQVVMNSNLIGDHWLFDFDYEILNNYWK